MRNLKPYHCLGRTLQFAFTVTKLPATTRAYMTTGPGSASTVRPLRAASAEITCPSSITHTNMIGIKLSFAHQLEPVKQADIEILPDSIR